MNTTKKILVVDDDIDVISIVKTILENENFQIITATGKEEAVKLALKEKPDLAICDVMMSTHYEGFELAKELVTNPEFKGMPVLMQTSINVFTSSDADTMRFARNYRTEMGNSDLDVLLVQNDTNKSAGIDYKDADGAIIWVPINGFIPKPVKAQALLENVNRVLN